jgi:predicted Zn finger-like uncharacterized protein
MSADPRTINVSCPHCGARYLLPANLLGPGGARVRCPGCSRSFDVPAPAAPAPPASGLRETPRRPSIAAAATTAGAAAPAPAPPAPPAAPAPAAPATARSAQQIARELLEALSGRNGERLSAAVAEGSLFSKHGPEIFAAYDEFRRRAPQVGAAPFRAALRELWGVELPEVTPRP